VEREAAFEAAFNDKVAAEEKVDDSEGYELLWYATQEIEILLSEMGG